MNWTIEQLRAFVTAAEKGSFSAAGRVLGRAQSVVSTHISMLEDSLGVELFDRSSRSPVLTAAGRDLLPEAHAVLRQSHRFDACAIAQYKGEAIRLNVSASHGIPFQSISESVASLMARYPFLTGSFRLETQEDAWRHVAEGQAQISVILGEAPQIPNNCEMVCLGQLRYCLVASKHSALGKMDVVRREDLAGSRQILVHRHAEERYLLSAQYWEVNDVIMAMYWASRGIGWTVVPLGLAKRVIAEKTMQDLVILNMDLLDVAAANVYLLWNLSFTRRDVLDFFIQDLKDRYRHMFSSPKQDFF